MRRKAPIPVLIRSSAGSIKNNGVPMRTTTYVHAINEALRQLMEQSDRVFLMGQGVTSPWYVGNTTVGLLERFGHDRVIDTPVSENGITGAAVGAALAGMRPIVVHPRLDFMYYAFDPIMNHAANWRYMFGDKLGVPVTIWGIINRGGEQSAQHSQAIQALFAHIPGLKVVMPATPYDAKGLLVAASEDGDPVVFIDDRWLYDIEGEVPEELYSVPIGKGVVRKKGKDITIVASSYMAVEALKAAYALENEGLDIEVIDLRTIKPLDAPLILRSLRKTGRLLIADGGWKTCGISAEVSAIIAEGPLIKTIKAPVMRVALPDVPAPASSVLEKAYYKRSPDIGSAARQLMES
jgi:acetoin:2,6-dichlorophenolindophenol oxidoreductase subunit beta